MKEFMIVLLLMIVGSTFCYTKNYHQPEDKNLREKIFEWQGLKFGLMMHWGPYSQWGVVESWSLCSEEWIRRDLGRFENYPEYVEDYENLQRTFIPRDFNPEKWADIAEKCGMKYVVFTTKHLDGFCMFDTKTTDYKVTSEKCPFSAKGKRDVTGEIFEAFREKDLWTGVYFSKPDWHSKDYWWPYYPKGSRHVNYNPAKYPEKWNNFKEYTYTQIEELMSNYGKIDLLWLDGAWVRPYDNTPDEFKEWAITKDYDQDIDMPELARRARKLQKDLIIVDRWVEGEYENYLTPENKVPDEPLFVPWESCVPMAGGWSYNRYHQYKSVKELLTMLVDVVSKGGNFLLNIGPSPNGDFAPEAYERLEGIADWMKVNKEAIYESELLAPYKEGNIRMTQMENGTAYFFFVNESEGEIPEYVTINSHRPAKDAKVQMLGYGENLTWEEEGETGCKIKIPKELAGNLPCDYIYTFKFSSVEKY